MFQYQAPSNHSCCESKICSNVQIPSLPLKGPKSFDQILHYILEAIEAEAEAADFYRCLMKEAPNKLHREFIEHAYEDELEHLQIFIKLYTYYTDCTPQYHVNQIHYSCYKDGLLEALVGELKAVDFYRNVQLSTMDQVIRDTFYLAMVDELGHATMFSTLYGTCK